MQCDATVSRVVVDQKAGDELAGPARCFLFARRGKQDRVIGDIGIGDEMFGAIDDEVFAITHGPGFHGAQVRAGLRFGHGQTLDPLAPDGGQQILLDLIALAGTQNVGRARHGILQGKGCAAQFDLHQRHGEGIEAAAAQVLGHVGCIKTVFDGATVNLLDQFGANIIAGLDLILIGHQLLIDKTADRFDNQVLFFRECKIHGNSRT